MLVRYCLFLSILLLLQLKNGLTQVINWANLPHTVKDIPYLNVGLDYGLTGTIGYAHRIAAPIPVMVNIELSLPAGKKLLDEYKIKAGGQLRWFQSNNVYVSSRLQGIYRVYQNDFASLTNLGIELSTAIGLYKKKWFAGLDAGVDKPLITHISSTPLYKETYTAAKDGWYSVAGYHIYFLIQSGYSFKNTDVYVKAGSLKASGFQLQPLIPLQVQLGCNIKVNSKCRLKR